MVVVVNKLGYRMQKYCGVPVAQLMGKEQGALHCAIVLFFEAWGSADTHPGGKLWPCVRCATGTIGAYLCLNKDLL